MVDRILLIGTEEVVNYKFPLKNFDVVSCLTLAK